MKLIKISGFAAALLFAIVACNEAEEPTETIDLSPQEQTEAENTDEGNSIDIDVKADDEGNVDGELSGDIELKDRN